MNVLGITGGIGSGKSVISQLLELMGIPVYLSDNESKNLLNSSSELKKNLTENFGAEIYANGMIDRQRFAFIIFNNPEKLKLSNSIIHPFVKQDFLAWVKMHEASGKETVAIESAILYESGFNELADKTIFVSAPLDARVERVIQRDKVSADSVFSRIKNQASDDEKLRKSDYLILNDEKQSLLIQLQNILRDFRI